MRRNNELINLYWRYWPVFAGVLIIFYIIWVLFTPESFGSGFFPATLVFALRVAATYAAVKSIPRIAEEGQRRAWRYFGVGLWIWTISDAVDIVAWGLRGEPWSEPAFSDLLHLAGYLAMLTGCATYPQAQPGRFGRIREALEVSILAISVLSISWLIYLSPSIATRTFQINKLLWLTISPIMDLILLVLGLRLMLLQDQRHERLAFSLFSFGFIVLFISDMAGSYSQVVARATIPSMTQAGWMGAATILGLAFQWMTEPLVAQRMRERSHRTSRWIWRIEPLIPIAFTYTVVGYVFFDWWFTEDLDWVALAGAGSLIILLFARQGVIAGQREMSQFAALVNSTSDMAFILDGSGRIKMANPAFQVALGNLGDVLNDLTLENFIQTGESVDLDALLEQAHENGWSGEVMLDVEGVELAPILLSLSPVVQDHRGDLLLSGAAHDLSPIRHREDELRLALDEVSNARSALEQLNIELEDKVSDRTRELADTVKDLERLNTELKELDQLKSEFVALVSHELRAPMTNIRGGIELMLEKYPDLEGAPKRSLSLVQAEVQRLSSFVETVLDLSALEAGRFPIELAPVDVEAVLRLVLGRFPDDNQARVKLTLDENLALARADDGGLESVFFHLLDNAFKYTSKGEILINLTEDGDEIECRVRDSGPGIPVGARERIFEMFHRLDVSDSREIYGYGLGLPMVERLLSAMDGRIEVRDSEGGGTEMMFWLPQAKISVSDQLETEA
jgi:PAS domain S-box-containing protein